MGDSVEGAMCNVVRRVAFEQKQISAAKLQLDAAFTARPVPIPPPKLPKRIANTNIF
jgi:hypothetical protein